MCIFDSFMVPDHYSYLNEDKKNITCLDMKTVTCIFDFKHTPSIFRAEGQAQQDTS
jgi:hypothetical protein